MVSDGWDGGGGGGLTGNLFKLLLDALKLLVDAHVEADPARGAEDVAQDVLDDEALGQDGARGLVAEQLRDGQPSRVAGLGVAREQRHGDVVPDAGRLALDEGGEVGDVVGPDVRVAEAERQSPELADLVLPVLEGRLGGVLEVALEGAAPLGGPHLERGAGLRLGLHALGARDGHPTEVRGQVGCGERRLVAGRVTAEGGGVGTRALGVPRRCEAGLLEAVLRPKRVGDGAGKRRSLLVAGVGAALGAPVRGGGRSRLRVEGAGRTERAGRRRFCSAVVREGQGSLLGVGVHLHPQVSLAIELLLQMLRKISHCARW